MNYAEANTCWSRGHAAGVECWNVSGIRDSIYGQGDGERAGCPPGIQRGDMEPRLSNDHPAFSDSSGMESVVRNVVVTVSVPPFYSSSGYPKAPDNP